MSASRSSAQQKAAHGAHGRGGVSQKGGNLVEVYLHFVKDTQAALLAGSGSQSPIQDIKQKSGADVQLDPNPSPVQDTKTVIIRGSRLQIETAVRLINQETGDQESISRQAQTFWLQWVEAAFPDLDSRAYFLPPVYINRVPMTRQSFADQHVLVLKSAYIQAGHSSQQTKQPSSQPFSQHTVSIGAQALTPQPPSVQDSDVRDDAAMQHVFLCLQELFKKKEEILFGMTQLLFGQYLGKPCYAAAAAQLPLPTSLPPVLPRDWKRGDFDVLLIHRHFGLVVCEVKAFGDNVKQLNISQQSIDNIIRKKTTQAMSQLDKAEAMLSHLVSDIAPGLRITKTIVLPNITARQLQQSIFSDIQLTQDLCRCLGTRDAADIAGVCLCSDQLSDPKTPWDVSSHVLRELEHWWQRRVAGAGPDSHMTPEVYKNLIVRFCGPATTVTVPCTSPPRMCIKTLGEAVSYTGECYTAVITLFPEQVRLLNTADPRVCLAGPPGTGKTVVLLLKGIEWLRCGHHVHVVITCDESRVSCIMLYHLLLKAVSTQQSAGVSPSQLHLLQIYFPFSGTEKAVVDLIQAAENGQLYVIADEVDLYFFLECPAGWQVEYLTKPLRSPPAVVREVEQDYSFVGGNSIKAYSDRGVPDHTDGPPVITVRHKDQGHNFLSINCVTCGREVASILNKLRKGFPGHPTTMTPVISTSNVTTPSRLQWRDMMVLHWNIENPKNYGLERSLKEAGIPVRVMKDDDIQDVATARSDVVWIAYGERVQGLERKVIVCTNIGITKHDNFRHRVDLNPVRLYLMSRCTSQLVIITDH